MPLLPTTLASSLESDWLVAEGGDYPDSPEASGDRFAGAVSGWFAGAMAGPYPCGTAAARRSQLGSAAGTAFRAQSAQGAASQLALGLMAYMAGQVFGPGVASPPMAVGPAQSAIAAVFADLDAPLAARAQRIAAAVLLMANSTLVVFPPVISPPTAVL